jgi:putative ABC transport system ATP-binding protein
VIVLDGVSRTYHESEAGAVTALRPLSLTIDGGSVVAIVGPSGSGKSTLLNLLGGLDRPTTGRVLLEGQDIGALDDDARTLVRRNRMGFVFQFFHLMETMTARENVLLPARLAGQSGPALEARATALLDRVGLAHRTHHAPHQLSGGEMQRVAVARALIMDPPLLLCDEPTGNLDSDTGAAVLELLTTVVDGRRTIVLVTHDAKVAARAHRVITLRDGGLVSDLRAADASRDRAS